MSDDILYDVAEGIGTRKTARLTGVHKDTPCTRRSFGTPTGLG